jgi:hypothetical protein
MTNDAEVEGPVQLVWNDERLGGSAIGERDAMPGSSPRKDRYESVAEALAAYSALQAHQQILVRGITDQSGRLFLDRQGISKRLARRAGPQQENATMTKPPSSPPRTS